MPDNPAPIILLLLTLCVLAVLLSGCMPRPMPSDQQQCESKAGNDGYARFMSELHPDKLRYQCEVYYANPQKVG